MKIVPFETQYVNRFITGLHTQRNPLVQPLIHMGLRVFPAVDVMIDGQNTELSAAATVIRRPGFINYSTANLNNAETPLSAYSYKDLTGTIRVLVDTDSRVVNYSPSAATLVFTKGVSTRSYFTTVGKSVYWGDGTNLEKWDGTTVSLWGITAPASAPTLSFGAGSLTSTVGWLYAYVYKNSTTGHISSLSAASASTGVITAQNVTVTGARSTDPQVDKVDIYRTFDGGSTYFFLAEVANPGGGTWTYVDSSLDATLNTGLIGPQSTNTPPPAGLINTCFHMGRVWGSVNNLVYFSGGAEILNGVPFECWPAAFFFTFPGQVTRLIPNQLGLIVLTKDDAYIIRGYSITTFYSQLFQTKLGVAAWDNVAVDGDNVFMFTNDRTLLQVSSNGINEIGFTIGDKLQAFNPVNTKVVLHRENSSDNAIFIYDGGTQWYRFDLGTRSWSPVAALVSTAASLNSVEISAATYKLLLGSKDTPSKLLQRDQATFSDAGAAYSAYATFGVIPLAPPGNLSHVESILYEVTSAGTLPTVSIMADETAATFTSLTSVVSEPPELAPSTTVRARRCYLNTTNVPRVMRFLEVKLTFATEAAKNELYGFGLFAGDKPAAPKQ